MHREWRDDSVNGTKTNAADLWRRANANGVPPSPALPLLPAINNQEIIMKKLVLGAVALSLAGVFAPTMASATTVCRYV